MVHALRQARRVLKSDGYLLDLRPAPVHRRVGLESAGSIHQLAVMEEEFDDDYKANQAVEQMVDAGFLKLSTRIRFDCTRRMDRFIDFQRWLDEYIRLTKVQRPERLLEKIKDGLRTRRASAASREGKIRIVVLGPVDLRVLLKQIG
jgi:hypothetical protein